MKELKKPFIGAAYYPEDWPESEMENDIAKMQEIGIRVARIGEFAWSRMEPQPDVFDFAWLHEVVDRLDRAGIRVIMGTPTAVPPIWLTSLDPEMRIADQNGHRAIHGGRRHACSNNPLYLERCDKIVTALAKEFGTDENIIGWQIDNEIFLQNCHCRHCTEAFRCYLKDKYGTIEELNRRWNLTLFSSAYRSFEDIAIPGNGWMHPQHIWEHLNFDGESQIRFVARQAAILKAYVRAPIGTDQMPFNKMDYRELHRPLDVIQFNHYNTSRDLWECGLWMDYFRTMKETPFWNTETSTGWNGATAMPCGIHPDGFCYANTWMPVALGGEANLYWLWRTHWAGHELMHGSVLESSGRPQYMTPEITQASREFDMASDFVTATKVVTQVALHFTSANDKLYAAQPMIHGFVYDAKLKTHFYKPLTDSGLRPDVIDAQADLTPYKLVFSPLMPILDEHGLPERIAEWVRDGGVWVTGPMTNIRTADGSKYRDRLHGMLEQLTPAYCRYAVPDIDKRLECAWKDGGPFGGGTYYELFDANPEADLVTVTAGSKALEGLGVVQHYRVGRGAVILLGTLPDYEDMRRLIRYACGEAGVPCDRTEGNSLLVADRRGESKRGVILVDIGGGGGVYHNHKPLHDILTGRGYDGDIAVSPYQVLVLEELA